MASEYYGLNRGQTEFEVTEQNSSPSKDVELKVDLTKNLTKAEVILILEMIENHLVKGNWPPA